MENLVVANKIKKLVNSVGLRASKEFIEALSELVGDKIIEAAKTCKASNMTTIKKRHLL